MPSWTLSDFLRTRIHALRQPSPILQFYEVAIPDGTFQRYVDFADKDAGGSLPSKIPFNGSEYTAIPITRGDLQESTEGAAFQLPVSVHDPLHIGATLLRANKGLVGCKVDLWLTTYDWLDHPEDAYHETFEVISSGIGEGPDSITLTLGHPNLYEIRIPKLFYDRRKCISPYHDRFTVGNWCRYPSNEFSAQTKEDLLVGSVYANQARKNGWWTAQGRRCSVFDVSITNPGDLTIATSIPKIAWKGRERYGISFFRPIAGDFDIRTKVSIPTTSRTGWLIGLLAQDQAEASPPAVPELPSLPASSWIIWGVQENSGSQRLAARVTTANATAADTTTASSDLYLRMVRTGNSFALYSTATWEGTWTLRTTKTLTLPATAHVGVVVSADGRTADPLIGRFEFLRFLAGGLSTCKRTWADCEAHGNTVQFNGYREMPSDRARY